MTIGIAYIELYRVSIILLQQDTIPHYISIIKTIRITSFYRRAALEIGCTRREFYALAN